MIQIYDGNGKGKTTAAIGLAVRAAGHRIPVLFIQFLKDAHSGEISVLRHIPGVHVLHAEHFFGFSFRMTEEEKEISREEYRGLLTSAALFLSEHTEKIPESSKNPAELCLLKNQAANKDPYDMKHQGDGKNLNDRDSASPDCLIVLDEVLHAVNAGLLEESELLHFLDEAKCSLGAEIVLTGTDPGEEISKRADYISEIRKVRHPFDRGILARKGIEE
ncbi:cob(I)yrinic acid a,c-diamide adenosyltransferase [Oribacterium sp. HCP28S3_H8]|uniref:cob(I)yrinic acid a,c-diamide adenosyltransferase n=1 Tax=Oribacterium sp. HCP28S3_H8 TaxID=3438945 RepID=UPI003F8AA3C1